MGWNTVQTVCLLQCLYLILLDLYQMILNLDVFLLGEGIQGQFFELLEDR